MRSGWEHFQAFLPFFALVPLPAPPPPPPVFLILSLFSSTNLSHNLGHTPPPPWSLVFPGFARFLLGSPAPACSLCGGSGPRPVIALVLASMGPCNQHYVGPLPPPAVAPQPLWWVMVGHGSPYHTLKWHALQRPLLCWAAGCPGRMLGPLSCSARYECLPRLHTVTLAHTGHDRHPVLSVRKHGLVQAPCC